MPKESAKANLPPPKFHHHHPSCQYHLNNGRRPRDHGKSATNNSAATFEKSPSDRSSTSSQVKFMSEKNATIALPSDQKQAGKTIKNVENTKVFNLYPICSSFRRLSSGKLAVAIAKANTPRTNSVGD